MPQNQNQQNNEPTSVLTEDSLRHAISALESMHNNLIDQTYQSIMPPMTITSTTPLYTTSTPSQGVNGYRGDYLRVDDQALTTVTDWSFAPESVLGQGPQKGQVVSEKQCGLKFKKIKDRFVSTLELTIKIEHQ